MATRKKLYKAEFIDLGRNKVNGELFFNTTRELHKEIGKHILSKGWDMLEVEPDSEKYEIVVGFRVVGNVNITQVQATTK